MKHTKWKKYCEDINSGKIPSGNLIKLAVKRFEGFLNNSDMYFDEQCVDDAIDFISCMKHFLGKTAGKPFILEPFQEFLIANILGIKWVNTGHRVCKEAYIQVARKCGKDALVAAINLYLLIADGEASPELVCCANSREQARILFKYIDEFARSIDPKGAVIKHYRNYISVPSNGGICKVISSDASKGDGMNLHAFCVDEYHEAKSRDIYDVLKSSQGMRTQPLGIIITTAGFNLESPCHDMYMLAIEILNGVKEDDTFMPFIWQLDEEDDWTDPKNFIKVQPNLGVTVTEEFMLGEVKKALNDSTAEVGVRTKVMNQWCNSANVWIPQELIARTMKPVNLEDFMGSVCIIGMDLASVGDFCSITAMIEKDEKRYYKTWTFLPEDTYKNSPNKELYTKFVKEDCLIITPGNCCDYDYIINKICEINNIIPVSVIYTDAWNATQVMIKLGEIGFNVQPFSQAIGNYNACTKQMELDIKQGNCIINKSVCVLWQFGNVFLKFDHQGNCLALDTEVPTPNGMKTIANLEVGDYVFSYDGTPTKVIDTTPVNYDRDCYKLTFNNGAEVIADEGHQWYIESNTFNYTYRDTEWIYNHFGGRHLHTIMNGAVEYAEKELPIDPYTLGLWLGDGSSHGSIFTVSCEDMHMYDWVTSIYGTPTIHKDDGENWASLYYKGGLRTQLKKNNLLGNKHIPEEYFTSSIEQRMSLLQGLMDTDGTCNKMNFQTSFTQKNKGIIDGVARLLDSLGIRHSSITFKQCGRYSHYNISWYTDIPVFRLERKLDILKQYIPSKKVRNNLITSIEKVESVPTKCITVEDEKHLFLVTDKYLVTGNCKPDKSNYSNKIDSVISMCTALGGSLKNPVETDFELFIL